MTRMHLWGPGTAFADFEAFLESMKKRGVSFLEMLAMEMKAAGKYVARGLSFKCGGCGVGMVGRAWVRGGAGCGCPQHAL